MPKFHRQYQLGGVAVALGLLWLSVISGCGHSDATSHGDESAATETEEPVVEVSVKKTEKRNVGQSITTLGKCEALPQQQAVITPAVEGQVAAILVEQGATVKAGQSIVQLDTTLAAADIAEKNAARDSLEASLRLAVSQPRTEEQATTQLAVEQATIAVELVQAQIDRLRPLAARKEVPETQVFDAERALKQAELQKRTAEAQYALLMLRPRSEAIDEAKSKIKVAQTAVDSARARLELHTLRAPIDGVLNSLSCRRGQTIAVGNSVGEIIDDKALMVVAWAPVARAQKICVGQTARVHAAAKSPAADDKKTEVLTGHIVFVGKVVDPQTGNVPLNVRIDAENSGLLVGQPLYVAIDVEAPTEKLCVPSEAIHDEGDGPALTVVRDGKAVVLHPQVGAADEGWIAVSDTDLNEGEPVAVAGAYNLPDGTPVKTHDPDEDAATENKGAKDDAAPENSQKSP